jgi:large subunit ribosomal protein L23Ae
VCGFSDSQETVKRRENGTTERSRSFHLLHLIPTSPLSLPLSLALFFPPIFIFLEFPSLFNSLVQAKKSASALKKGSGRKATKVHTKVHFYKPRTLKLARNPAASIKTSKGASKFDAYKIVKFPLTTESAMKKIEDNNTLVFIVDVTSNKRQIKEAVSKLYSIKAEKVNTLIRFVLMSHLFSVVHH